MQPLHGRVQKLRIIYCKMEKSILKNLPLSMWLPELRDLTLQQLIEENAMPFEIFLGNITSSIVLINLTEKPK